MKKSHTVVALLMASTMSATPVLAASDSIIGGILGGIGAAIVINELNKDAKKTKKSSSTGTTVRRSSAQREQMRDVQTRLNTLGYDAGVPDGVSGPRTRAAISAFQLNTTGIATGSLSPDELVVLYQQSSGIGGGGQFPVATGAGGQPGANGAFPALGAAPAPAGAQPGAFPSLGATPAAPAISQSSAFPTLAATPSGQNPSAFPTIGTPTAALQPGMPLVDGANPALGLPATARFDTEMGKTIYTSSANRPQILGFSLGSSAEEFTAALEANGFKNCVGVKTALQCQRQTGSLSDTIKVWSAEGDGVWAIARLVRFTEPVQADYLHGQFNATYPELMQQPQLMISSNVACDVNGRSIPTLAALFDARDAAGEKEISQSLVDLSVKCPVSFSVAFNQGNGVASAVQTVFFDGTSVVRQQINVAEAKKSQLGEDLKF